MITTEEHSLMGGFGSAVLEALQEEEIFNTRIKCVGLGDIVLEHGSPSIQRKILKLDPEGMFETIMTFYGTVAKVETSGNGKKPHSENGENGKKVDTKIKQPLNG
jgi:deoxyxylulose-5-phosphate synthase